MNMESINKSKKARGAGAAQSLAPGEAIERILKGPISSAMARALNEALSQGLALPERPLETLLSVGARDIVGIQSADRRAELVFIEKSAHCLEMALNLAKAGAADIGWISSTVAHHWAQDWISEASLRWRLRQGTAFASAPPGEDALERLLGEDLAIEFREARMDCVELSHALQSHWLARLERASFARLSATAGSNSQPLLAAPRRL